MHIQCLSVIGAINTRRIRCVIIGAIPIEPIRLFSVSTFFLLQETIAPIYFDEYVL